MNTRTLIIIGGIVIVAALLGFWYFFSLPASSENTSGSSSGGGGGLFGFLNFGGSEEVPINGTPDNNQGEIPKPETPFTPSEKLRMLVKEPVSAAIATTTKNGFSARYIDRATGHVSDVNIDTGEKTKVSNTTIPQVQEGFVLPGAEELVLRYFDETYEIAETYGAKLVRNTSTTTSTEYASDGAFLDSQIESIAPSPNDTRVAYVVPTVSGSTLFVSKTDGTTKATVFTSPAREWLVQWPKADTLALTSKPSAFSPGYLYFVPSRGGSLTRVLGAAFGLTTLVSPAGTEVLFSGAGNNTLGTALYTISSGEQREFPVKTLPEKCIWSKRVATTIYCGVPKSIPPGAYPDVWYQGSVSFTDELWSINTTDNTAALLASPGPQVVNGIDVTHLSLNKDETTLTFINKKDGSLWALDLRE